MSSLHPEDGVRLVFERQTVSSEDVVYRVSIYGPGEMRWETDATIVLPDGKVSITPFEVPPPVWAEKMVKPFLRTLARKTVRSEPLRWPRKLTRWRAPAKSSVSKG